MKPRSCTALALILILGGGVLARAAAVALPAPKMTFAATEHDVIEVKAGDVLTHTYLVRNEGDADLVILNVAPG